MFTAVEMDGPVAIRYPRGRGSNKAWNIDMTGIDLTADELLQPGRILLLSLGVMTEIALGVSVINSYSIHYTKLYESCRPDR